jgi:hypothetical protein
MRLVGQVFVVLVDCLLIALVFGLARELGKGIRLYPTPQRFGASIIAGVMIWFVTFIPLGVLNVVIEEVIGVHLWYDLKPIACALIVAGLTGALMGSFSKKRD